MYAEKRAHRWLLKNSLTTTSRCSTWLYPATKSKSHVVDQVFRLLRPFCRHRKWTTRTFQLLQCPENPCPCRKRLRLASESSCPGCLAVGFLHRAPDSMKPRNADLVHSSRWSHPQALLSLSAGVNRGKIDLHRVECNDGTNTCACNDDGRQLLLQRFTYVGRLDRPTRPKSACQDQHLCSPSIVTTS